MSKTISGLKYFTLFGERNSGTNYLSKILEDNLHLTPTKKYGFKHWYLKDVEPRGRANTTTDRECLASPLGNTDTLFVITVRNPYDWVAAMYARPYSIRETDGSTLLNFVRHHYIAYELGLPSDHGPDSSSPWSLDPVTNQYFIEESDNLLALRNEKNRHFLNLENHVEHFWIVRQEHLDQDLTDMVKYFDLESKHDVLLFDNYQTPRKYIVDAETTEFVSDTLDNEIDDKYYLPKILNKIN